MRIERLMLHDVGPFDDLDITFEACPDPSKAEVHMFVGPNGSGKSTILYALAQIFGSGPFVQRFRDLSSYAVVRIDGGYTAITPYRAQLVPALHTLIGNTPGLSHSTPSYHWDAQHKGSQSVRDYMHLQVRGALPESRFSFAAFAYAGSRTISPYQLHAIQEVTESPFARALSFTNTVDSQQLMQWIANTKAKEALALARGRQDLASRRTRAIERIEEAIHEIINQEIRFVMMDEPLEVRILQNESEVALDLLPDGLKSIISWIADLLMRLDRIPWQGDVDVLDRPFFLFLDEIEIHLHPAWQRKILPAVQRLFPNAQIFLSTHSPFVVGSVSDAWVYPLAVENGKAKCLEPLPSKAGESYQAILGEVFGIEQEFDIETEDLFGEFYELKRRRLQGDASVQSRLDELANQLRERSVETRDIVEREMRQLQRLLGATA